MATDYPATICEFENCWCKREENLSNKTTEETKAHGEQPAEGLSPRTENDESEKYKKRYERRKGRRKK